MRVKFNEAKLKELGYSWNIKKEYMFKSFSIYKNDRVLEKFTGALFIDKEGKIEIVNNNNLIDMELKKIKEVLK